MKKHLFLPLALSCVLAFSGCGLTTDPPAASAPAASAPAASAPAASAPATSASAAGQTVSHEDITFSIDPAWTLRQDGAYITADERIIYGINTVSDIGSNVTAQDLYDELLSFYRQNYDLLSQGELAETTSPDGTACMMGEMTLDIGSARLCLEVLIAPDKNEFVTAMGQSPDQDRWDELCERTRELAQSITFTRGTVDRVTGNVFLAADGSQLFFEPDGTYYYYADSGDHSTRYYAGTYSVFRGQPAIDQIASMTDYGLTADEIERVLQTDMGGYSVSADRSSVAASADAVAGTGSSSGVATTSICRDMFYAVVMAPQSLVTEEGETAFSGETTLYIGYDVPERNLLDMTNCNAGSYAEWTLQGSTDEIDGLPTAS